MMNTQDFDNWMHSMDIPENMITLIEIASLLAMPLMLGGALVAFGITKAAKLLERNSK